jgi:hypothetical protein
MPTIDASGTPRAVSARHLADAVHAHTASGEPYTVTDGFGVTYTGTPAYLVLAALSRHDITPDLCGGDADAAHAVRELVALLTEWFTSDQIDAQHAAAFTAMAPARVCEIVAYLATHGEHRVLSQVGPESLHHYTEHLTTDALDDPATPLPTLIDSPPNWLRAGAPPDITATTADGTDTVALLVDVDAAENISWSFRTTIEVPVATLHDMLVDPDELRTHVEDHRDLIEDELGYSTSVADDEGLTVEIQLVGPGHREADEPPVAAHTAGNAITTPDRPRIEIVSYRDPDAKTYLHLFVDGVEITDYAWTEADPGAGHDIEHWRESRDAAIRDASPAAAELIQRLYDASEDSEFITGQRQLSDNVDGDTI